jgi:hypothetical protein
MAEKTRAISRKKERSVKIRVEPKILEWLKGHCGSQRMAFEIGLAALGCKYALKEAKAMVKHYPPAKLEKFLREAAKRLRKEDEAFMRERQKQQNASEIKEALGPKKGILKGTVWAGWGWLRNYVPRSGLVRKARDKAKKGSKRLLDDYDNLLTIELFHMGIIGGWSTAMMVHNLESAYPKETRAIHREIDEALKERKKAGKKDPLNRIWFRKMTGWESGLGKKDIREMKGESNGRKCRAGGH